MSLQRQQGHHCDWLDADEVKAQWPWLGPSHGALWAPREGAVDPVRLVEALLADAKAHRAVVVQDQVTRLEQAAGRVTGVRGREFYAAPEVVIAAGAWSGIIEGMPRPLSVEPVRGQMAALPWPIGVPPAIMYNRDCYLVYRDGEALIGSTMEYAGFDPSTTAEGIARIRSRRLGDVPAAVVAHACVVPGPAFAPYRPTGDRSWAASPGCPGCGTRRGTAGTASCWPGITGVIIRELLDKEEPREEMDALRADRFWRW